jgi:hypothetical protein
MRGTNPLVGAAFQGWCVWCFGRFCGTGSTGSVGPAASDAFERASAAAALSLSRQHCLYFRPEPQWQGSLRPGLGADGEAMTKV